MGRRRRHRRACALSAVLADFDVFGWNSTSHGGAYLIPITLINLTTLVILVVAMCIGDSGTETFTAFRSYRTLESLVLLHRYRVVDIYWLRRPNQETLPLGEALVAFGRNKEGIYRLWPKDEVRLFFSGAFRMLTFHNSRLYQHEIQLLQLLKVISQSYVQGYFLFAMSFCLPLCADAIDCKVGSKYT